MLSHCACGVVDIMQHERSARLSLRSTYGMNVEEALVEDSLKPFHTISVFSVGVFCKIP
jgi:hypothetical protein